MSNPREIVDAIESLIHEDVGRNVSALFSAAKGGLWSAASALASQSSPRVGLITGFYVPLGTPPAAETDGPVGVALLVNGLRQVGVVCRVATDEFCRGGCAAALKGAEITDVPIDVVTVNGPLSATIKEWRDQGVTHAISIERCGRSADGRPRNMRGMDIGSYTAVLDDLFSAGPWDTIAVGDGGNEIGMGSISRSLIAEHVAHGDTIACVTPAAHLIVAGVSDWGAFALLGALAVIREDWRVRLISSLATDLHRAVLESTVYSGPAVDGVSRVQALTVDNLDMERHHNKLTQIRSLVDSLA